MKKLFATALSISAFAIASDVALAQNSNAVFAGVNAGRNINYGYFGAATALNGNIEKDGALLRVSGGYGQYTYQTPAVIGGAVRGQVSTSDLMAAINTILASVALQFTLAALTKITILTKATIAIAPPVVKLAVKDNLNLV